MIFHSWEFVLFFIAVFVVYWSLKKRRWQNLFLLLASYFFYGYVHHWFLLLLLSSSVVDYFAAIAMERYPDRKKLFLAMSLTVNLGMLGFFKYFNFFIDNVSAVLHTFGVTGFDSALAIILPVGISFYTFQELSYTIDVFKGRIKPVTNIIDFALFVSFFAQLVAGPIERAEQMVPQYQSDRKFSWTQIARGLELVTWGYFKKLVIADNIAIITNKVFLLENPTFPILWVGVLAYAFQLFADFSAYTDIARGVARFLGFELRPNFNHPYIANSPSNFWRRWHMSLSEWMRDYVYIPLGGSRKGELRTYLNVIITFLVSGLWHGASWNFVLWGLYWGVLIAIERAITPGLQRIFRWKWSSVAAVLGTFVLTTIGWLLFRETDTTYLIRYLSLLPWEASKLDWQIAGYLFVGVLIYAIPLWLHTWFDLQFRSKLEENKEVFFISKHAFNAVLIALIIVLHSTVQSDFIYFQF